jgi:hypothetical protein
MAAFAKHPQRANHIAFCRINLALVTASVEAMIHQRRDPYSSQVYFFCCAGIQQLRLA